MESNGIPAICHLLLATRGHACWRVVMPPPTPPYQPVLSALWTPLVAVTASWQGRDNGQIAVSAHGASIVPDRPRVLVQLYKRNLTHDLVRDSAAFALHL